jgi:hypothetical protein
MCQIVKKTINFRIILYLKSIQGLKWSLTLKILKSSTRCQSVNEANGA